MTSSEQSTSSNPPITTGSRLGFTYGLKKECVTLIKQRWVKQKGNLFLSLVFKINNELKESIVETGKRCLAGSPAKSNCMVSK